MSGDVIIKLFFYYYLFLFTGGVNNIYVAQEPYGEINGLNFFSLASDHGMTGIMPDKVSISRN